MKCGVEDGQVERTPDHIIGICAVFRLKFISLNNGDVGIYLYAGTYDSSNECAA